MQRGLPLKPRSEWEHLISEWIHNARYREIMQRNICDGETAERLAERYGFSVCRRKEKQRELNSLMGRGLLYPEALNFVSLFVSLFVSPFVIFS